MPRMIGCLIALLAVSAGAAEPQKISLASPGLNVVQLDPAVGAFYADHFAQQLVLQGLTVITGSEVQALLGFERQKALLGCAEDSNSCLAELAGALGVDGLITGSIGRAGKRLIINIKIVSARDASALSVQSGNVSDEDELVAWLERAAKVAARNVKLALAPESAEESAPLLATPSVSSEPRVGSSVPSIVLGGIGGILLISSGITYLSASSLHSQLKNQSEEIDDVNAAVDQGNKLQGYSAISGGLGVAALIGAGLLYFNREDGEAPVASLSWTPGSVGIVAKGVFP